jgi:hypothetical protein
LPEIAQDRISSVRVKFDPYQDCFNSSGASQSEDRNDKQKTGFFDSIGRKQKFKLRHYRKAPAKAIAAAPERPASGNAM